MQITIPTTKAEMYNALTDIFYYYRIQKTPYVEATLLPLNLDRMEFAPLAEADLLLKAQTLVLPAHKLRVENYKKDISDKIAELQERLKEIQLQKSQQIDSINAEYFKGVAAVERQASKRGMSASSITVTAIGELELKKQTATAECNTKASDKIAAINARISALNELLSGADDYLAEVFSAEVAAKAEELKEEQEKTVRDVFKYNNTLEENEQRYLNTLKQINANLSIKYLEVNSSFLTKDQLVEMGYYNDVINCVCGYYDTLAPLDAYDDITGENKLCLYLDDYYASIVHMYRVRAGQ